MRRTLCASLGAALALCTWAGTAAADTGSPPAVPSAGQAESSDPAGDALALVGQYIPDLGTLDEQPEATETTEPAQTTEPAAPAPPAEPAESEPAEAPAEPEGTSQSNGSLAGSLAGNGNETGQTIGQEQGGQPETEPEPKPEPDYGSSSTAPTGGQTQVAGQSADNKQDADADADSTQIAPENANVTIRVFSPGDNGPVTQSNDSIALAGALNANKTAQDVGQSQSGSGTGSTQIAGQKADNEQDADADADSKQVHPKNTNVSVRIFSPGNDGPVSQSNTSIAGALAANGNETAQSVEQDQTGGGPGGSSTQVAGQKADNDQDADADADSKQVHPKNTNVSVRIFSPGDNGPVRQSNTSAAGALAVNTNATCQCITQSQSGGPGGSGYQIAGQLAKSEQDADADADSKQIHPTNENASIRVGSPGADGPVSQSNTSLALAGALNANETHQSIGQQSGGPGLQVAGQKATSDQHADADADAEQYAPSNVNAPVRVLSPGGGGSVEQSNAALAGALAANLNKTAQSIDQEQSGGPGGPYVQAAGQLADNEQKADADADATQCCAENVNAPVAVLDKGKGHDGEDGSAGSVEQSNLVVALAAAVNLNGTHQSIGQSQSGPGGLSIQAAGQKASNDQDADADAEAFQIGARNVNAPVRILGKRDRCDKRRPCDTPYPRKVHDPKQDPGETGGWRKPDDRWKQHDRCELPKADPCRRHAWKKHDPCTKGDRGDKPSPCEWKARCSKHDPCERKSPRHEDPRPAQLDEEVPMS
jgi:hypothetical protein